MMLDIVTSMCVCVCARARVRARAHTHTQVRKQVLACYVGDLPANTETYPGLRLTVSSHNFNSQKIKLRLSNPRTVAYFHFKMLFESSDLSGAGHISPD